MRYLTSAVAGALLLSSPVSAQTTLNLSGDTANGSPTQVILNGQFKSNLFPFVLSADSTLDVTLTSTTMGQPLFVIFDRPFGAFVPAAALSTPFTLDILASPRGSGTPTPFSRVVLAGDYTLGIIENFAADPGGTYEITVEGGFIVPPPGDVEGFLLVLPNSPTDDAPIHVGEIALESTRDRHGAIPNSFAGSMDARSEASLWRNANAPIAHRTNNGTTSGKMHLWADIGGGGSDNSATGLSVRLANTQVGVDYAFTDNIAAGVAIGAGVNSSKAGASKIDGYSYWFQPYVGARFGKASATASFAIARDDYSDINLSGVTGSGSGFTFSGNLTARWDENLVDGWFLTPYLSGTIGRVRLSDTNVAGLATGSFDFFDVAAGVEFRNEFDWGFGASQFWVRGEGRKTYTEATSSGFAITGHDSTRFGFGVVTGASIMVDDHVSIGGEASVDGLGSDVVSFGGRLNATIGF